MGPFFIFYSSIDSLVNRKKNSRNQSHHLNVPECLNQCDYLSERKVKYTGVQTDRKPAFVIQVSLIMSLNL